MNMKRDRISLLVSFFCSELLWGPGDGEICGDVLLFIPELEATEGNSLPTETHVRCRWWGEKRPGSLFRPLNKRLKHVKVAYDPTNTVVYPIVAEQAELKNYFQDMVRIFC